jgi:hypothetical protein
MQNAELLGCNNSKKPHIRQGIIRSTKPQKTEHKRIAKTNYAKHNLFVFVRKDEKSSIAKNYFFANVRTLKRRMKT